MGYALSSGDYMRLDFRMSIFVAVLTIIPNIYFLMRKLCVFNVAIPRNIAVASFVLWLAYSQGSIVNICIISWIRSFVAYNERCLS